MTPIIRIGCSTAAEAVNDTSVPLPAQIEVAVVLTLAELVGFEMFSQAEYFVVALMQVEERNRT